MDKTSDPRLPTLDSLVLGVDGGGTKTLAWLAPLANDGTAAVLGRGLAGPGNPRAVGFDAAQANIDAAIAAAFAAAGLPRTSVAAACFGLAGAGRPDEQQQIAAWAIGRDIAAKVKVTDDAEPILAAASPDCCGIALIAGTGSLCLGRNQAGETARCGGWGYLLGDEGSGYAIALAGLRAAMRAADGRGPPTDLLPRLLQALNVATPPDLVAKVYSPEMTRTKLAALAALVFDLRSTDPVAESIVEAAAKDLVELAVTLAGQLQLPSGKFTLALAGGALLKGLNYLDLVVQEALARELLPERWVAVPEPVRGAVALARML